ncbi:methyl-accepting chemotaxis protein [Herbaspirillum seropedicae]|uniref:methyl-accepting chemotaxis protein n=1 Tax=Herbaspirillum seropedicae TaxID=964 RepID=UPI00285C8D33|nr:methyl-accepting chemotaxis protein [Herbaspirillum seropedicae]MDR6397528.1 methyl-accepting chemotaxis protein [Herbaspirillum seropedicae]
MEELTSTVQKNAENAVQASAMATSAVEIARRAGEAVSEFVDTMNSINMSSRQVVEIIAVIDGIAFQTNILALNAAVEAARAGEQGLGFAIVANEVRALAQRSDAAAQEIKILIDQSVNTAALRAKLVINAGDAMSELQNGVRRVNNLVAEIALASAEQRAGIEQVNQAIALTDLATQENALLVKEAAAASDAMNEQAGQLAEMVSIFRLRPPKGGCYLSLIVRVASCICSDSASCELAFASEP